MAVGLLTWALAAGSSEAQQDGMYNCPQAGKWAISVWENADGAETGQALATCGAGVVDFAYYLDPATNSWLGYFAGRPEVSKLLTLNNIQGIIAHGAMGAPPRTSTPEPTPGAGEVAMHNCPQAGKWAISVWDGPDGTETGAALAMCGEGAVDFAYYLDPATNGWLGYFEGQPEISQLLTLDDMQGIIAHGAMAAPTPTPTATPDTAGDVVLVSSNAFTTTSSILIDGESRRMHIVGEVRNESATPRSAGEITTTIYDAANNVVGSRWNYAFDNIIMPGRTTAFAVAYPSLIYSSDETNHFPEGWTRYEITLSPRDPYDWEDKPVDIAVENVQVSEDGLHVTGNAVNSSSKTVDTYDVEVYVMYYRADGTILNVGQESAVNDQPLGPGQSASFDITFGSDEPVDFSSYVVQAYAEAE
jgi:hypothetical protein